MASINDVVKLSNDSVGVIGAEISSHGDQQYRLYFFDSHLDITDADISQTLSAPTYSVNEDITVWPYLGVITSIDGDEFTVDVERQQVISGLGPITWTGSQTVPRWRVIRDNDARIERVWA